MLSSAITDFSKLWQNQLSNTLLQMNQSLSFVALWGS